MEPYMASLGSDTWNGNCHIRTTKNTPNTDRDLPNNDDVRAQPTVELSPVETFTRCKAKIIINYYPGNTHPLPRPYPSKRN